MNGQPKKLLFLLVCALISCVRPSETPVDAERRMLAINGIHSITEWKSAVFAGQRQPWIRRAEKYVDSTGAPQTETEFNEQGVTECIRRYYYDDDGRLLLVYAMQPAGNLLYKMAYRYEDDKLAEMYFHLPDGSFKYRQVYEYDLSGRLSRLSWYWPTGLRAYNLYMYDGGKKISDEEYDADNNMAYRWRYSYTPNGELTEAVQEMPDGKISRRIRSFYEGRKMVLQQFFIGGDLQDAMVYRYNKVGLPLWRCSLNASNRVTAMYRFEYGN